ncbi:MAG: hypothetical protein JNL28_12705 [Planctomycetes bacterium]|nr:hypothetical protein [Planctomycetota bacterium]
MPTFSLVVGLILVAAILAIIVGIARWRQTWGKVLVLAASVVLLTFAAVVCCVLITVSSGSMG